MTDFSAFLVDQAEASPHVKFVYDVAEGRVVFVNRAYETVLHGHRERAQEELPDLLARLHPEDRTYLAHYWKLWVRGQMHDEVEVRLLVPNAPDQWFCLTPHYQRTADNTVFVAGTLRDISAAKHYQLNADNFNTRKNATLEILSHDLSNSFVLVQQIAEYLRAEIKSPAGSRVPDMLGVLETTSQTSLKMIRDLINIEFLASANTNLKRDRVEIAAALRPPLDELRRGQEVLGQRFSYSLPTEPIYVSLDVNKFTQVLTNLIGNAFKFTPDGGEVNVQIEPCPDCVRLHVQDNGVGIPEALLPYVFDRFTKARRPGLRGEPTIGLGLALCKTIVEWHKGTISVASTEGKGTTFTIEVPRAEA